VGHVLEIGEGRRLKPPGFPLTHARITGGHFAGHRMAVVY